MKHRNDTLKEWGVAGPELLVGLDLGDKTSRWAALDPATGEVREGQMGTKPEAIVDVFAGAAHCTVVMEAGTHAPWVARKLRALGHRSVVVDPAILNQGRSRRRRKNDRKDALDLMEVAQDVGRRRVKEIWQRPEQYQQDLSLMRTRDAVVRSRALLANAIRGMVKTHGERIEPHSVESLPKFARAELSGPMCKLAEPVLGLIEQHTEVVDCYDQEVKDYLARRPESSRLLQIHGVGPVTVGAYMAVIGDPTRFRRSRDVPAYLGLVPGEDQSGDDNPQLRITKGGDELVRRLLIQCAHFTMSSRGQDSDLRDWALKLAGDGKNKTRKKKAVVALARKLATLLHQLWVNGEEYRPFKDSEDKAKRAAAKAEAKAEAAAEERTKAA